MNSPGEGSKRVDRGYLGYAATRIARLLDVAGLVTPEYNTGEKILPVILVADGTIPGAGLQRQRRWSVRLGNATINYAFKATVDVVVTHIHLSSAAAGASLHLNYLGPEDGADPWAIATAGGNLLDRARSNTEKAPILTGTDNIAAEAGTTFWSAFVNAPTASIPVIIAPFLLPAGGRLICRNPAGVNNDWSISGFVF